jgi:hypothetical protein
MTNPTVLRRPRSRWLDWKPKHEIIETTSRNNTTKPTKPSFEGFVASSHGNPQKKSSDPDNFAKDVGNALMTTMQPSDEKPLLKGALIPPIRTLRAGQDLPKEPAIILGTTASIKVIDPSVAIPDIKKDGFWIAQIRSLFSPEQDSS